MQNLAASVVRAAHVIHRRLNVLRQVDRAGIVLPRPHSAPRFLVRYGLQAVAAFANGEKISASEVRFISVAMSNAQTFP